MIDSEGIDSGRTNVTRTCIEETAGFDRDP